MKLKHLLALALVAMGSSAWAQNLLKNSDFSVLGDKVSGTTDRYAVGEPWVSNVTFKDIRVMTSTKATQGGNVLIWRGSGNNNYISQKVAAEAGAAYEITINQVDAGNANANFNVGIGTEAGKYDVVSDVVRLGTNNNGVKKVKILMPEAVEDADGVLYFTFANTNPNSASSGSDPVTQIDYIKMEAIDALALAKEKALDNLPSAGDPIFGITENKIEAAKTAINNATTRAEVEAATSNLTIPALSGSWAILNATNGLYLGNAVLSAESMTATFEKASGGFYIKIGDKYINMRGDNNWSMSADATAKTAWTFTLVDNKYTIKGPKGLIGTDATTAGSAVYGNKDVNANGYWTIVDLEAAALESAKGQLLEIINLIPVPTANITGSSDNLITWNNVDAITSALDEAQDVLENSTSVDEVTAQIDALENLKIQTSNKIVIGSPYNIIMAKEGLGWSGNAATFYYKPDTHNQYGISYSALPGKSNYNQAVIFGKNLDDEYVMYIVDAEGESWYLTDGTHAGSEAAWAGSQLRMTKVEDDAMPLGIMPSLDKEGVCEIVNIWTGEHIGSTNNDGFYCSNDNYDLSIVEAEKKEITVALKPTSKYGTIILPYECETIPEGAKFYSVSSVNDSEIVLSPKTEVKANTPYIVEGEPGASFTFSGYANAFESKYTTDLLTGVYAETSVPVGSYVMQTKDDTQKFYIVAEGKQPKLAPNKAYLTVPPTEAKVLSIGFAEETAIKALDALMSGDAKIYDMNGREQKSLQKGVNIVNGVKVMVK